MKNIRLFLILFLTLVGFDASAVNIIVTILDGLQNPIPNHLCYIQPFTVPSATNDSVAIGGKLPQTTDSFGTFTMTNPIVNCLWQVQVTSPPQQQPFYLNFPSNLQTNTNTFFGSQFLWPVTNNTNVVDPRVVVVPFTSEGITNNGYVPYSTNFGSSYFWAPNVGGGGGGGVTSVGLALPTSYFNITGSPVTSTGNLTATFVNQNANTFLAGPLSGPPAIPTPRQIVSSDLPFATVSSLGAVTVDNTTVFVNGSGQLSASSGGEGNTNLFVNTNDTRGFTNTGVVMANNQGNLIGGTFSGALLTNASQIAAETPSFVVANVSGSYPDGLFSVTDNQGQLFLGDAGNDENGTQIIIHDSASSISLNADAGFFFTGGPISGNGSSITALNATQLTTGTIPPARLPIATASVLGGVKPDGTSITITGGGVISASVTGSNLTATGGGGIIVTPVGGNATIGVDSTVVRTNGSGQYVYQPMSFVGPINMFSNNTVLITNGLLQFGTASGNNETIQWGDATNNQKAALSLNSTHGGGRPNGDGSEMQWDFNQMSFNGEGHVQLTKIFSANLSSVYITRWRDATVLIPITTSHVFDFQFSYWSNGVEQISQIPIQAVPQDTNGNVDLNFLRPPPSGSDTTNVTMPIQFAVSSGIGIKVFGAIISDVQTVVVGSNSTLSVDLLHPNEDVRLNGPITVALTNLGILNAKNENTETMQVYFNSGLMGNCPITWNFGAAVTTNWESPFGPIAAPTNCPPGSILHFTFTPLIRDGVTNLTCSYQMENFTPVIDTMAASFFAASPTLFPQESNQVNYLVKDLRKWNLLANWDAIYPMVGGSSNTCSWNLIDTTKFRIAWTLGSSTFDHTGWNSDGVAAFGNTQFNPSTATTPKFTQNSASIMVYGGTANPAYSASPILFMGSVAGGIRAGIGMSGASTLSGFGLNNTDFSGTAPFVSGVSSFSGMNLFTRTGSASSTLYAPSGLNNGNVNASTGIPNASFYIGGENNGGLNRPSALKFETAMLGGAVSLLNAPTINTILANFNNGLNR